MIDRESLLIFGTMPRSFPEMRLEQAACVSCTSMSRAACHVRCCWRFRKTRLEAALLLHEWRSSAGSRWNVDRGTSSVRSIGLKEFESKEVVRGTFERLAMNVFQHCTEGEETHLERLAALPTSLVKSGWIKRMSMIERCDRLHRNFAWISII